MTAKTPTPSDVAIITVSYNSSAQLESFLSSASKCVANSKQIYVVDNNSEDIGTTRKICSANQAQLLELNQNFGYGGAINRLVSTLSSEMNVLLICNPDTKINKSAIIELNKVLNSDSNVGIVGPRIVDQFGVVFPSARKFPSILVGAGHSIFGLFFNNNPWTKKYHSMTHYSEKVTESDWLSGACFGILRKNFDSISGFDEKFFMYFEDVDICYRLNLLGFKNLFVPSATVVHIGGLSTRSNAQKMKQIHHQSAKLFINKKYSGTRYFLIRPLLQLGLFLRDKISANK